MRSPLVAAIAVGLLGGTASGQAFNIDVGGAFSTPPSDGYGAGAEQAGYWNAVGSSARLRRLDGTLSAAQFGAEGGPGQFDIPGATGGDELLMESVFTTVPFDTAAGISNLTPGVYDLYIYSWYGNFVGDYNVGFRVYNGESEIGGEVNFHEQWPGGHVLGETYDVIRFEVLPDVGGFVLFVGSEGDMALINGLQLVPVPGPGAFSVLLVVGAATRSRRR